MGYLDQTFTLHLINAQNIIHEEKMSKFKRSTIPRRDRLKSLYYCCDRSMYDEEVMNGVEGGARKTQEEWCGAGNIG